MSNEEPIVALFPEVQQLQDAALRKQVVATWLRAWRLSGLGERLLDVPFSLEAPTEPLVRHVRRVIQAATLLATQSVAEAGPAFDWDILRAACLLHDVDKVLMLEPAEQGAWRKAAIAHRLPHGVLGAMICRDEGVPEDIVHLVVTHPLSSPLPPVSFEGVILHYADFFVADSAIFQAGAKLLMNR